MRQVDARDARLARRKGGQEARRRTRSGLVSHPAFFYACHDSTLHRSALQGYKSQEERHEVSDLDTCEGCTGP